MKSIEYFWPVIDIALFVSIFVDMDVIPAFF